MKAIAAQIAVFIIGLVATGIVLIVVLGVFGYFQAWQQNTFPTGVYDVTTLNFLTGLVVFAPLSVILIFGIWLLLRAQERAPEEFGN